MNETQQLLALMGVTSEAEGIAAMQGVNAIVDAEMAALGTTGIGETLRALASRSGRLSSLEKAAGKAGDEADGLIRAALLSHAEMPTLRARVAELEKAQRDSELAEAMLSAEREHKLTPAYKAAVQLAYDSGDVTLAGAKAMLAALTPIAAFAPKQESAPTNAPGEANLTHNGKRWSEMTGVERASLKKSDPSLYEAMRKSAA